MCDLSLPDYTSRIINVGVQLSGIENVAPAAIDEETLNKILLFASSSDKEYVLSTYQKVNTLSSKEQANITKTYSNLETNDYVLKSIGKEDQDKLDNILKQPMLMVSMLSSDTDDSKAMVSMLKETMQIPENMDIYVALQMMPQEAIKKLQEEIGEKLKEYPDSIMEQAAITYDKVIYQNLGANMDKMQTNYIIISGLKMLGIAALSMACAIGVGFLGSRIAAKLGKELREKVYEKTLSFSSVEIKEFGVSSLITRTTNDIQQIQSLIVMLFRVLIYAPIIGVGGVIKVLTTNASMTWIIALAVGVILSLVITLFVTVMPSFQKLQKQLDHLNQIAREILTGLPVIRAFSNEKHEEKRFEDVNHRLMKTNLFVNRIMSCMMPIMMFVMNGVAILIIWRGAYGIDAGSMQVGDLMAYIQYTMQIIMAFLFISMMSIMLPRASVSMKRIDEVINKPLSIKDPKTALPFNEDKKGIVEFNHVYFQYPDADEEVLEDISFVAKPGETTAFIGSTGSGKSTLINLIPRLFDVTKGEIYVDGVDIRNVKLDTLHDKIGYVPQKGILFSGTIRSNITYGNKEATDEEVQKAAEIAQAEAFIEEKDEKYASPISQGGSNVSGGQKQRLSIARAIAKHPDIYIFDDSFSALDFKTDAALRKALKTETKDSTVLIVAQRISTVLHAEQIIVLDQGKIVGKGTHEKLMKSCKVYQEIAASQLSKEELANE